MSALAPTRRQKVEEREQAILSAAHDVFIESGYEGARMAEIARRAGIAEGTVYIYYKTKADLMRAIIAQFWSELTIGADHAVHSTKDRAAGDVYLALRSLGEFHIRAVMERFDLIELALTLRASRPDATTSRSDMKTYVAVFDGVFQRGIDQGIFSDDTPIWIARDLFYGTLEYSARTLLLRDDGDYTAIIDNLVAVFRSRFARSPRTQPAAVEASSSLALRLETAIEQLEHLTQSLQDQSK